MATERAYEMVSIMRTMRVRDLAAELGCPCEGDREQLISRVASLEEGGPETLGFLRSEKLLPALEGSRIAALIAPVGVAVGNRPVIRSNNPGLHFARAVSMLHPAPRPEPGVHPMAQVDPSAEVDPKASIGPHCSVGAGCRIGPGTVLFPQVSIYADVEIGAGCVLHSRVVVREGCRVGNRVVLQPGVVLGGDGFGYVFDESGGWEHIPHVGAVIVEDDVEIGANSAIDRSMLHDTRIGRGTKIDNLVMVAHNCEIGEHTVIAAQAGMAGGSTVERRAIMMGQSALSGHLTVGEGAFIGARAAVSGDVPANARVWGTPHQEEKSWARSIAIFKKLPQLVRRVRAIEKHLGLRGKK